MIPAAAALNGESGAFPPNPAAPAAPAPAPAPAAAAALAGCGALCETSVSPSSAGSSRVCSPSDDRRGMAPSLEAEYKRWRCAGVLEAGCGLHGRSAGGGHFLLPQQLQKKYSNCLGRGVALVHYTPADRSRAAPSYFALKCGCTATAAKFTAHPRKNALQ